MRNKTTSKTPVESLHGYSPKFNCKLLYMMTPVNGKILQCYKQRIKITTTTKMNNTKFKYDRKVSISLTFKFGEVVNMRTPAKAKKT